MSELTAEDLEGLKRGHWLGGEPPSHWLLPLILEVEQRRTKDAYYAALERLPAVVNELIESLESSDSGQQALARCQAKVALIEVRLSRG